MFYGYKTHILSSYWFQTVTKSMFFFCQKYQSISSRIFENIPENGPEYSHRNLLTIARYLVTADNGQCRAMTGYDWLCMVMYGYVWLCMTKYVYVWLCRAMYGYVGLCMAMYGFVGLCRAMSGYVWLCMAM